MATEFVLPSLQHSLQVIIGRWLKKAGDQISAHEKLLEVHNAQFDWDIPAPADGTLSEIRAEAGAQVAVGDTLAVIEVQSAESKVQSPKSKDQSAESKDQSAESKVQIPTPAVSTAGASTQPPNNPTTKLPNHPTAQPPNPRISPLAARIAAAHQLDVSALHGSGVGRRVTKNDVLALLADDKRRVTSNTQLPIANYQSPQTTLFIEIDVTNVLAQCEAQQAAWQKREGFALTPLPFIVQAVVAALQVAPTLNATISEDELVFKQHVHLGVAGVVSAHAEAYNLIGLARRLQHRAPDATDAATFTLDVREQAMLATGFIPEPTRRCSRSARCSSALW